MLRLMIACVLGLVGMNRCCGENLDDGIYPVASEGTLVSLAGGGEARLGKRRNSTWDKAAMKSRSNDNTRFAVELHEFKSAEGDDPATVVLVIDGVAMPFHSRIQPADGPATLVFNVDGEEASRRVATKLKVQPVLRKHPGHRVILTLTPDKESYKIGDSVSLKVGIRNIGDVPILFQKGGKQRGPRDNQFRFIAHGGAGMGKAVADTGDPDNHGGLSSLRMLKPGETIEDTVALDKWFTFSAPDTYRVTGVFELELSEMPDRWLRRVIWEELVAGECLVKVEAKQQ